VRFVDEHKDVFGVEPICRVLTQHDTPIAPSTYYAAVAGALAQAGQHEQAETVARSITHPYEQGRALAAVAGPLAQAGQHEQAETMARSITHPEEQARALTAVARVVAARGDTRQAHDMALAA
jgi:hypothetical protein